MQRIVHPDDLPAYLAHRRHELRTGGGTLSSVSGRGTARCAGSSTLAKPFMATMASSWAVVAATVRS